MRNKVLYLQLCLLFIISSLPVQKAQAGEKDTPTEYNTPIYGEWSTKVRSLSPIPFTASISGDQLTLKCTSPDYDINITIVNANGQPVWQRDIAAPETSFVSIPLDSLPQGSYTIEISNDYGGYLQGTFQL
ncbi:DUF3244 domain-containing protein [Bacteroides cellulosilyticus]|jgi:hypothetical protein|uniref:DUF3244 domain-containing protein n=1 Tax=Bacteroides cellulosilyticus TaxID=246787 RepID=UPI0018A0837B|nr:DUF3244 domain-containing protein [Bacteroides cellulosilyticus]MBX9087761.1 DUF3244 domain-containing protein [Bacteroides cellulosilyticus]QUT92821.1 protein of unknown function (DUF3244) [Bacteroides cellulosilyticus]